MYGYNRTLGGDGGSTLQFLSEKYRNELIVNLIHNGNQGRIKEWRAHSPDGEVFDFFNMRAFCREKKLDPRLLWLVTIGKQNHHKGWKCWNVVDSNIVEPSQKPKHHTKIKWSIIGPDDTVYEITQLKNFCIEYNLSYKQMHKVTQGFRKHHKGFRIIHHD